MREPLPKVHLISKTFILSFIFRYSSASVRLWVAWATTGRRRCAGTNSKRYGCDLTPSPEPGHARERALGRISQTKTCWKSSLVDAPSPFAPAPSWTLAFHKQIDPPVPSETFVSFCRLLPQRFVLCHTFVLLHYQDFIYFVHDSIMLELP